MLNTKLFPILALSIASKEKISMETIRACETFDVQGALLPIFNKYINSDDDIFTGKQIEDELIDAISKELDKFNKSKFIDAYLWLENYEFGEYDELGLHYDEDSIYSELYAQMKEQFRLGLLEFGELLFLHLTVIPKNKPLCIYYYHKME